MKILYNFSGVPPLFNKNGGAIEYLVGEQILFIKDEFEVVVLGHSDISIANIEFITIKNKFNFKQSLYKSLFLLPKLIGVKFDIIVSNHPHNVFSSFLLAKLTKKPWISWEWDHVMWVEPFDFYKKIYHKIVSRADKIITISEINRKRIISEGIMPEKVMKIYNVVDTNKFKPRNANKKKYLVYVAKFASHKNQLNLIKAFKKLTQKEKFKEYNLIIIGRKSGAFTSIDDYPSNYFKECERFIEENSLNLQVLIKSNITEEELIHFYQDAALFVSPSLEEGFGMNVLEAMSCGLPCLVNSIEPLTEVLGDAGKFSDASNVELFADDMSTLLDRSDLLKELGERARERAENFFCKEIINNQVIHLFKGFGKI